MQTLLIKLSVPLVKMEEGRVVRVVGVVELRPAGSAEVPNKPGSLWAGRPLSHLLQALTELMFFRGH